MSDQNTDQNTEETYRERVAKLLVPVEPQVGLTMLDSLETAGYRVLPVAAVPEINALAYASRVLNSVGDLLFKDLEGAPDRKDIQATSEHIDRLVKLACMVLQVDRNALAESLKRD